MIPAIAKIAREVQGTFYRPGVIASARNLSARTNAGSPNSKVDVAADELTLRDADGRLLTVRNVSVTIDIAVAGANGLDTGAEAGNTWYYPWIIASADGRTIAGILSTSSTAPTVPAGYTFKALVSAVRNNGSSNFVAYRQFGNEVFYEGRQSAVASGTSTSEATVSLSSLVPSIAMSVKASAKLVLTNAGGSSAVGSATVRYISGSDYLTLSDYQLSGQTSPQENTMFDLPNVSQQMFYLVSNGGGGNSPDFTIWVNGFKLPLGGE